MSGIYRIAEPADALADLSRDSRKVVAYRAKTESDHSGILFRCPCGEQVCNVGEANHQIRIEDDHAVTVLPSILNPEIGCHFWMKRGAIEMVGDSTCPGKDL